MRASAVLMVLWLAGCEPIDDFGREDVAVVDAAPSDAGPDAEANAGYNPCGDEGLDPERCVPYDNGRGCVNFRGIDEEQDEVEADLNGFCYVGGGRLTATDVVACSFDVATRCVCVDAEEQGILITDTVICP